VIRLDRLSEPADDFLVNGAGRLCAGARTGNIDPTGHDHESVRRQFVRQRLDIRQRKADRTHYLRRRPDEPGFEPEFALVVVGLAEHLERTGHIKQQRLRCKHHIYRNGTPACRAHAARLIHQRSRHYPQQNCRPPISRSAFCGHPWRTRNYAGGETPPA
jgi:hypothetical protein